jgi:hypothetical protein
MVDNNAILVTAGPYQFLAKFEAEAPKTVATFQKLLPYRQKIIHVRWSAELVLDGPDQFRGRNWSSENW